ncbi:MAG: LicD family protein [Lachnospiraceae bacterium]|nr:LicD family protein [Lachnospiraceae bacterium]
MNDLSRKDSSIAHEAEKQALTPDEIKKAELDILLSFRDACDKNGLHMYLAYGTLLGAIRHKGFIPWDDDIDVALPRPEYDRVVELSKQEDFLPPNLHVSCMENGEYAFPFMKIYDLTTVVKTDYLSQETGGHIWIDVFPVDGVYDDPEMNRRLFWRANMIKLTLLNCMAKWGTGTTIPAMLVKLVLIPLSRLYGAERCRRWLDTNARKNPYDTAKNVGILVWSLYGDRGIVKKEDYERRTEVEFEGHTFHAVADYDSYLRSYYGDYMTLPPEDKRTVHAIHAYRCNAE